MIDTKALLLDMGGVVMDMAGGRGFPAGKPDWRGREALLHLIRSRQGSATMDSLERELFEPWHRHYEKRQETFREAAWEPHLERLGNSAGIELSPEAMLDAWFRPYAELLQPVEGAAGALDSLSRAGIPIALVSNVPLPGRHYREVLAHHGLDLYFEHCFFSYDLRTRKPSPSMLRQAATALGVTAAQATMVGDRRDRDILAGQLAGMSTVWVRSADSGGPTADYTIESLADLPGLIGSREI